jgi:hypothetical protein
MKIKRVLLRIPEGVDLESLKKLGYEIVKTTRRLVVEGYPAEMSLLIKEAKEAIKRANLYASFGQN